MLVEKRYEHPYYLKIHFQLEFFTHVLRQNSPPGSYHHPTTPPPPTTHTHTHKSSSPSSRKGVEHCTLL